MPDYAVYRLNLSTITPLHIGSGETLLHKYDYAIHNKRTWRINDAAFLEAQSTDNLAYIELLAQTAPADLLEEHDYTDENPFFRYIIQGTPRSAIAAAELQEQLKDTFDQPFIPGSSLKGALRTAMAWYGWGALGLRPKTEQLGNKDRWAAQPYERIIFNQSDTRRGQEPNYDLLRALQIGDSKPVEPNRLMVLNACVLNCQGGLGAPIALEAIRPDTTFEMTVKLDLALFSEWAQERGLHLDGEKGLRALPAVINQRTFDRLAQEIKWYASVPGAVRVLGFYQQMYKIQPQANQFLLQLGWGTGWDDKTFGSRLKADPNFMEVIIQTFRLARGHHQPGQKFPASKRVAVSGGTPISPLGWLLVTFESVRGDNSWKQANAFMPIQRVALPAAAPTPSAPIQTNLPDQSAKPAAEPRPTAPRTVNQPVIRKFTRQPEPGQHFSGKILHVDDEQAFILLPGLSGDEWIGVADASAEKLVVNRTVVCEVIAVRADPDNLGGWLVDCKIA